MPGGAHRANCVPPASPFATAAPDGDVVPASVRAGSACSCPESPAPCSAIEHPDNTPSGPAPGFGAETVR